MNAVYATDFPPSGGRADVRRRDRAARGALVEIDMIARRNTEIGARGGVIRRRPLGRPASLRITPQPPIAFAPGLDLALDRFGDVAPHELAELLVDRLDELGARARDDRLQARAELVAHAGIGEKIADAAAPACGFPRSSRPTRGFRVRAGRHRRGRGNGGISPGARRRGLHVGRRRDIEDEIIFASSLARARGDVRGRACRRVGRHRWPPCSQARRGGRRRSAATRFAHRRPNAGNASTGVGLDSLGSGDLGVDGSGGNFCGWRRRGRWPRVDDVGQHRHIGERIERDRIGVATAGPAPWRRHRGGASSAIGSALAPARPAG